MDSDQPNCLGRTLSRIVVYGAVTSAAEDMTMDEKQFWTIIDDAWKTDEVLVAFRKDVLATLESGDAKEGFEEKYGENDPMIPNEPKLIGSIESSLDSLSEDEIRQFDVILERKLYDIDRQDVHEYTDGSDDGFLYCRGFIVAMGQEYYDAVNRDGSNAMFDWECEAMTYLPHRVYERKFGEMPQTDISRETCSNSDGWPE